MSNHNTQIQTDLDLVSKSIYLLLETIILRNINSREDLNNILGIEFGYTELKFLKVKENLSTLIENKDHYLFKAYFKDAAKKVLFDINQKLLIQNLLSK